MRPRREPGDVRLRLDVDLGSVSNAKAKKLLAKYGGLARGFARRIRPHDDDLAALAEIAIIEAAVLYRKDSGAHFDTWVFRIVRWRVKEALPKPSTAEDLDIDTFPANGRSDHEKLLGELERDAWVRAQVEALPRLRQRHILAALMRGESYTQIASQLGLSRSAVYREAREAMEQLWAAALLDGVVVVE
jgi:RNA polymerase sigma factor (sigma-70 family)